MAIQMKQSHLLYSIHTRESIDSHNRISLTETFVEVAKNKSPYTQKLRSNRVTSQINILINFKHYLLIKRSNSSSDFLLIHC